MSSYHYLYRITNIIENRHYYGSRTCHKLTPQEDLGIRYFSSSTDKDFIQDQKQNPQNYRYKVIIITKTREKATTLEQKIQQYFDVGKNMTFYNKAIQTSKNYCAAGRVTAKDMLGNIMSISKDDPRYLSGELVGVNKGLKMPNGHQSGKNNSQFGTIWIYNLELKLSKPIKKEELPEYISLGWLKGRKMNFF
jgi:hypothetical protein